MLKYFSEFADTHAGQIAAAIPVGVAIASTSGTLLFVNSELERMTGYEPGALLGQQVEVLLPEQQRAAHAAERETYALAPSARPMGSGRDLWARRRDGSTFPVEIGLRPMEARGGQVMIASIIDLSERRRLESSFRAIVASAPHGMLLVDKGGQIRMVNDRLCDMFGFKEPELIGERLEILLPERWQASHVAQRDGYARNPEQRAMGGGRDLTGRRKDGREFPVEIGLSSVVAADGAMTLAAVVDITERKRAELSLHEANAQLEEFAYVSSHDLRGPIRGIGNLLEWIREDLGSDVPASVSKNFERMDLRIKRVDRLIEDLLVYARSGKRSAKIETIDIAAMVRALSELEPLPAGMTLELRNNAASFQGTATPLATVLRNLYTNAIKHHDRANGRILIDARDEGEFCVISVIDDGPGIPEAAQERVFRLFQTLSGSEKLGSGLGLAVARRLTESHGGRISLASRPDRSGCIFRLDWPRFVRSDLND